MAVWLHLSAPEIPSCADCQTWMYDERWKRLERGHERTPQPRPSGSKLPCWKCPRAGGTGRPNPQGELTGKRAAAYELYLAIRAGLPMPDDAIVVRNCALIESVIQQHARGQADLLPLLTMLMRR